MQDLNLRILIRQGHDLHHAAQAIRGGADLYRGILDDFLHPGGLDKLFERIHQLVNLGALQDLGGGHGLVGLHR